MKRDPVKAAEKALDALIAHARSVDPGPDATRACQALERFYITAAEERKTLLRRIVRRAA